MTEPEQHLPNGPGWRRVCPECQRWLALRLFEVKQDGTWVYRCCYCQTEMICRDGQRSGTAE